MKHAREREAKPPPERTYIEFPSVGAAYHRDEFGVYTYDTYPAGTVNVGQERRRFRNAFDTLDEARENFPDAIYQDGTGYVAWDLPEDSPGMVQPGRRGRVME